MLADMTGWFIRRPILVIVGSIILALLGATSFREVPITNLPSAEAPSLSVSVTWPGASPMDLAARVRKPVEDEIASLEGVRHIISSATDGRSVTLVQLDSDVRGKTALNDVKNAMERLETSLPQTVDQPLVQRVDDAAFPVVTYSVVAPGESPIQLSAFVDDVVRRALQRVPGVAEVDRIGGVNYEVSVALDPDRLQSLGLTVSAVGRQLRAAAARAKAGYAQIGGLDQAIRTLSPSLSIRDVAGFPIGLPAGGQVRLDEVGTVTAAPVERTSFVRFDGAPIVGFAVRKAKDASDVGVADLTAKAVEDLHVGHPEVTFRLIETSAVFARQSYAASAHTFVEGLALAIVVLLLLLRDLRAAVVVVITLAASIIPAFWAMRMLALPINLVSMLAFTMAIGFLVDDCVLGVDAIKRRRPPGTNPSKDAIDGASATAPAMIRVSLTIILILLSVGFTGGPAGQIFEQFGIVTSILLFLSLLSSRFLMPVLATHVLKPSVETARAKNNARRSPHLPWLMRYVTVGVGLVALTAMVFVMKTPTVAFLPSQDGGRSLLAVELPPGTPLSRTERVTDEIVRRLRTRPEIRSVIVEGGRIVSSPVAVHQASLTIDYAPRGERALSQGQLERAIGDDLQTIPDIRYWFLDENGSRKISFVVTGQDVGTVGNVAAEFARQIQRLPTVANVTSSASLDRLELQVRPRRDAAARLGITAQGLSDTIRAATIGDVVPAFAKLDGGDRLVPVRIGLDARVRGDLEPLEELRLPLQNGLGAVPLAAVADLSWQQRPSKITRYDREIEADVGADLVAGADIGATIADIDTLPLRTSPPPGVTIAPSGDAERLKDVSSSLLANLRYALLLTVSLLAVLFRNVLQPLMIAVSIALSIGVVIAVVSLTRMPISVPVYLGCVVVTCMVIKQGGMLVIGATGGEVPLEAALTDACRMRTLPISIATIATVAALLPTVLMHGAGEEFRSPAALVVICGVLVSAALSLVFVPAIVLVMNDVRRVFRHSGIKATAPRLDPNDQESD